jgi:hypothetical protein
MLDASIRVLGKSACAESEDEERMTFRGTLRGDLNALLNQLVQEERIAGFRTNLSEIPRPERPVATIFPKLGDDPEAAVRDARQALASRGIEVEVLVDPLEDLEDPESER